jgi:D-alanyl-D-alanine carboxypeptidase/D-alanyl-D-alanine-endopeptidase (penicillin-binding protein 4)
MQIRILLLLCAITLSACKSSEMTAIHSDEGSSDSEQNALAAIVENSETFSKTITGFMLYDPENDSTIYSVNEDKYMNPASNTKLFTYFAALKVLGDRLPALKYIVKGDSLIFWGTGDPSFLHPDFGTQDVFELLSSFNGNLYFSDSNFDDENLGPGWSWADYNAYYSAEKSPLPIYGNVARITIEHIEEYRIAQENGKYLISPSFFNDYLTNETRNEENQFVLSRDRVGNNYEYQFTSDTSRYETDRPFHYTPEFVTELLSDTLKRGVTYLPEIELPEEHQTIYSMETDSLMKYMLLPSDNLAAEQIMLMVASELGTDLNSRAAINHVVSTYLTDLPDSPNWRDGSGLSRYNLFTPRSIVALLEKIDELVDDDRLFDALPQGGKQGTIRRLYAHKDGGNPYVFAKTGTLSNNHCLSGYIVTEAGRKLLFSFMNNNYVIPTRQVQTQMDEILWHVYKNY